MTSCQNPRSPAIRRPSVRSFDPRCERESGAGQTDSAFTIWDSQAMLPRQTDRNNSPGRPTTRLARRAGRFEGSRSQSQPLSNGVLIAVLEHKQHRQLGTNATEKHTRSTPLRCPTARRHHIDVGRAPRAQAAVPRKGAGLWRTRCKIRAISAGCPRQMRLSGQPRIRPERPTAIGRHRFHLQARRRARRSPERLSGDS